MGLDLWMTIGQALHELVPAITIITKFHVKLDIGWYFGHDSDTYTNSCLAEKRGRSVMDHRCSSSEWCKIESLGDSIDSGLGLLCYWPTLAFWLGKRWCRLNHTGVILGMVESHELMG